MAKKYLKQNITGLRELRENMATYVRKVEQGEEVLVFKKSKPIFKLSPVDDLGDEGHWINFDLRNKNGKGISMEEFQRALLRSIAKDEQSTKILQQIKSKGKTKIQ